MLRLCSDAKVLRKGSGALDGGLVDALGSVEGVVSAVGGVVTAERPGFAGGEHVPGFDDIVFDEGVAGPAVEGEVAGAFGVIGSGVAYGPDGCVRYGNQFMNATSNEVLRCGRSIFDSLSACAPPCSCDHATPGLTRPVARVLSAALLLAAELS
jgi:hypothetical protein